MESGSVASRWTPIRAFPLLGGLLLLEMGSGWAWERLPLPAGATLNPPTIRVQLLNPL